jgi:PPP family 3-phenylpropionic acid transporter
LLASPRARARLAYVALYAAIGAAAPYLVLFYSDIGLDVATIGLVVSFGSVISLAAGPAWGLLSDRSGGSRLVLGGAAACAIAGSLGLSGVRDATGIFLAVIPFSAGFAGLAPILDTRALEVSGPERSGFGPLRAWGSISYIGASFGTGAAIDRFGIGVIFAIIVVTLGITALVGVTLRAQGTPPARVGARSAVWSIVLGPLGLFLLGAWLTFAGLQTVMAFYTLRFAELAAPATIIGLSSALGAAVEVPIMLSFPRLVARFGADRILVAGAAIFTIRAFGAALATDPNVLVALAGLGGVGYAFFLIGGITYVSRHAPEGLAATAQGLFSGLATGLAQVVAGVGGGLVAGAVGLTGLFAASGALGLAAAGVVAGAIRRASGGGGLRSSGSPSTGSEAPPDPGPSPE